VADAAGVEQAVAAAITALGTPTLMVACAGIVIPGRLETQPLEAFQRTMAVNYFGMLDLIRAVLPTMRAHGGGRAGRRLATAAVEPAAKGREGMDPGTGIC
jgi:3-dehydrosphinganine reductase